MENRHFYTKKVGSYLVISIYGSPGKTIAEVTEEEPLIVKVGEVDEYCNLRSEEFELLERESAEFQNHWARPGLLLRHKRAGEPIACGLRSLGINDGCFYEMLPSDKIFN